MAFTRDWLSSWILDHSKFKTQPSYVRGLMDDVGERLAAYLYGFTTTETFTGFKKVTLITIGTGTGDIPTGTGVQTAINLEARTCGTPVTKVELISIDADGNVIQLTSRGAHLANNTYLKGNPVDTGTNVNIIKVDTAGGLQLGQYILAIDTGLEAGFAAVGTGAASDYLLIPLGYLNSLITSGIPQPTVAALPSAATGNAGTLYLLKGSGTGSDTLYMSINTGSGGYGMKQVYPSGLGSWVDKSSSYGAQQAATDGFVLARAALGTDDATGLQGFTDSASDPTTVRAKSAGASSGSGFVANIMFPVKKGDYWKVTSTQTPTVYWIPIGG